MATIPQSIIETGVKRACMMVLGSSGRWQALSSGATDKQIRSQLAYEFGLGGGSSFGEGYWQDHDGGVSPKVAIWQFHRLESDDPLKAPPRDEVVLQGKELIAVVRKVFDLPRPEEVGQLRMF